jgi:hypothetical protein
MMTRVRRAGLVVVLAATLGVTVLGTAQAGDAPLVTYSDVQARAAFTVYEPTQTFGLARTGFELTTACEEPRSLLSVQYGQRDSGAKAIFLGEFATPCGDLELGYEAVATFKVRGAKAVIFARCPGEQEQCPTLPASAATEQAATIVTLPGVGGHGSTWMVVGTRGISVGQITDFFRTMKVVS